MQSNTFLIYALVFNKPICTIDKIFTNDEERMQAQDQLDKTKAEVTKIIKAFETEQLKHVENLEKELTTRHATDMKSDSWLSKNVRPIALIFLTVSMVVLAYVTIFVDLSAGDLEALEGWRTVFQNLLLMVYAFYFGSRGIEKVVKMRATGEDSEPKG